MSKNRNEGKPVQHTEQVNGGMIEMRWVKQDTKIGLDRTR